MANITMKVEPLEQIVMPSAKNLIGLLEAKHVPASTCRDASPGCEQ